MAYRGGMGDDKWTSDGGTCRPVDFAARAIFKELQLQINKLASRLGTPQTNTTGDIDPKTVDAVNAILAKSLLLRAKLFQWSYADCTGIAGKAEPIAAAFKAESSTPIRLATTVVDTGPATSSAPAPSSSPSSSLVDKLKTPAGLAVAGVTAVVLLRLLAGGGKEPPAKRAPRARGYKRRTVKRVGRQRVTTTYY
jgi:hypothetical protein